MTHPKHNPDTLRRATQAIRDEYYTHLRPEYFERLAQAALDTSEVLRLAAQLPEGEAERVLKSEIQDTHKCVECSECDGTGVVHFALTVGTCMCCEGSGCVAKGVS